MVVTASFSYWGGSGTPYAATNVNLPPEFKGRTCGLLGTATGSTGDDFQMPNGELVNINFIVIKIDKHNISDFKTK